ncbi:TPA: stage II sporulation protein M [Staphylococcus delphini]|nr:stage II sporulation protein M [Staphylococcus delphini]
MVKHLIHRKFLIINSIFFIIVYFMLLVSSYYIRDSSIATDNMNLSSKKLVWIELFLHNLGLALLIVGVGIISFGFLSVLIVILIFYLLYISFDYIFKISDDFFYGFLIISTHGILEILAMSLAFYLSTFSLRKLINNIYSFKKVRVESLTSFVKLILLMVALFLISSLIETFITPSILNHLLSM